MVNSDVKTLEPDVSTNNKNSKPGKVEELQFCFDDLTKMTSNKNKNF